MTRGDPQDARVAREFGDNNSAGARSEGRRKGEQGERGDSHVIEIVGAFNHHPVPIEAIFDDARAS
jgi:hypothetical protein